MSATTQAVRGLRVAVEGCGHGTLNAIYASVAKACEARGWEGVDLLIIGGDFQAVRNASDLTVMSCPVKYREIGDFQSYYSGASKAPYLTIFVGGNHEASSHLWELYYGGWVAPNIYYMGAANVVQLGGIRIAGMSGIWKGYNYNKTHYERLPYNQDDIKSIYHVREIDVRKILQLRTQVDVGISHDWPRAIENDGDKRALWRMKPDFEQESKDGTLGNLAASYVLDRLRPPFWFAAHMHCRFAATKIYDDDPKKSTTTPGSPKAKSSETAASGSAGHETDRTDIIHNADEIGLDMDMDDEDIGQAKEEEPSSQKEKSGQEMESANGTHAAINTDSVVPLDIRAQLPAAFSRPAAPSVKTQPGQPSPSGVSNKVVRFLALDKCLPGRKYLQLLDIRPSSDLAVDSAASLPPMEYYTSPNQPKFEYDPEWLAISRAFASHIILGDKNAQTPQDRGEAYYQPLIDNERAWVDEHIVKAGRLEIPENFARTAPIFQVGSPEIVNEGPMEYNNPQMQQFCDLLGIENIFFATREEQEQRYQQGPAPAEERGDRAFGHRGRGGSGGRAWGRGGRGGRGERGGRGRGGGRSRGRGW